MSLITLVINLVVPLIVVALILWAIESIFTEMNPKIRQIIRVLVILVVCLWLLSAFGLIGPIGNITLR